ncbi:DUF5010 domain-containing protein [Flavobacterium sp. TSSA_36]|uniref:DUF5010 domain-containing protein n=1 Tax=Flavobacterium sp. TSSA_36 TaxID=3447669 RepID=UPI003F33F04F
MKKKLRDFIFLSLLLLSTSMYSQELGATFAWHYKEMEGGHDYQYNQSIAKKGLPNDNTNWSTTTEWWENMAEEIDYAGLNYIALLSRGNQPNAPDRGNGNPKHISKMVEAMDKRGINSFKLAIFDDCPNSWTGSKNWNESAGASYSMTPKFDCSVVDNYKYIWDYNLKEAIGRIPDERRYKIEGRMVIYFWSVKTVWMSNIQGNLTKILDHIKTKCFETYGIYPYFVIDRDWLDVDTTLQTSPLVDAVHNWFSAGGGTSSTLQSWTDLKTNTLKKTGVCVPGFSAPDDIDGRPFLDPSMGTTSPKDNGARLKYGLNTTVKSGAALTLVEGFTDAAESAALWRSSDEGQLKYYDYPNQRLNILRSYSTNPYPNFLKMEIEACDFHKDETPGNSGGAFLDIGDLDVVKSTDTKGGWQVVNTQANEWMEWRELPLLKETKFQIRYKSTAPASIQFAVDGVAIPPTALPSSDGNWTTLDAGNYTTPSNSLHTVRVTILSGSPELNYFTRSNATTTVIPVQSIALVPNQVTLERLATKPLNAIVTPDNASNTSITWTSSAPAIATVDTNGVVTALKEGSAIITATSVEGQKTATALLTVIASTGTTLQAEEAVFKGPTVANNQPGYNGSGFLDFVNNSGDTIKWDYTAPEEGAYTIAIRYALPNGGRPLELKINNIVVAASLNFPATGTWATWNYITTSQLLKVGQNEIQLSSIGQNGGNIDEIIITKNTTLATPIISKNDVEKSCTMYPNPYKGGLLNLHLIGFTNDETIKISVTNSIGQLCFQTIVPFLETIGIELPSNLKPSLYFLSVETATAKIIKKILLY